MGGREGGRGAGGRARGARRGGGGGRRPTWEGDVSLHERTKIGHGCLGEISLGGVTRQLTLHLVVGGGGRGEGLESEQRNSFENYDCVEEEGCGGQIS